jgi:hypothetical protein
MSVTFKIQQRFAGWAAATGASASPICRFKVADGIAILESVGFTKDNLSTSSLPSPKNFNVKHRTWRNAAVLAAKKRRIKMSHGVAAKLINLYLKSIYICGGRSNHPKVAALHPPIDSILLRELIKISDKKHKQIFVKLSKTRWSKFTSADYELAISTVRSLTHPKPTWTVESLWKP